MKLSNLKKLSDKRARALLESVRWPDGNPVCPHCGNCAPGRVGKVTPNKAKRVREGLYQCKECRRQFSVTVGTVMECSKLPLSTWVCVFSAINDGSINKSEVARRTGCSYKGVLAAMDRISITGSAGPHSLGAVGEMEMAAMRLDNRSRKLASLSKREQDNARSIRAAISYMKNQNHTKA